MKNKSPLESMPKLVMTVTVIVLIGALFGTLGYYLGRKNITENTPTNIKYQKDQLEKESEKEVKDNKQKDADFLEKIADWKTYEDKKYGYKINYPNETHTTFERNNETRIDFPPYDPITGLSNKYITIKNKASETCSNPMSTIIEKTSNINLNGIKFIKEIGKENVAGSVYNSISYSRERDSKCFSLNFIIRSNESFEIDIEEESETPESILLTLEFTEPDKTAYWVTYDRDKNKIGSDFSFKYSPEIWNLEELIFAHKNVDGCIFSPSVLWRNRLINTVSSEEITFNNYKVRKIKTGAEDNVSGINYYFDSETSAVFSLSIPENKKDKSTCEKDTEAILNTISF